MNPDQKTPKDLANEYVRVKDSLDSAEKAERNDHALVELHRKNLQEIAEKLLHRVGKNIPTKVFFVTGGTIVIVEHERGIKVIEAEQ